MAGLGGGGCGYICAHTVAGLNGGSTCVFFEGGWDCLAQREDGIRPDDEICWRRLWGGFYAIVARRFVSLGNAYFMGCHCTGGNGVGRVYDLLIGDFAGRKCLPGHIDTFNGVVRSLRVD